MARDLVRRDRLTLPAPFGPHPGREVGERRVVDQGGEGRHGLHALVAREALRREPDEDRPQEAARARDTWERSVEFMRVGMGRRTAPGIERSFIFGGNEDRESTGRVSSNAIKGGLSTSRNRNNAHFLCFDEPDIGLSARLQAGLGAVLADFARDLPEHLSGLIVVTHAQPIVRALLEVSPRCARVGGGTATTAEWAASVEPPATAEEFLDLGRVATERMRAIQAIMNARKAEQAPRR